MEDQGRGRPDRNRGGGDCRNRRSRMAVETGQHASTSAGCFRQLGSTLPPRAARVHQVHKLAGYGEERTIRYPRRRNVTAWTSMLDLMLVARGGRVLLGLHISYRGNPRCFSLICLHESLEPASSM